MAFYFSPETFNPLDGDHDHALHVTWRTPRKAALFALMMRQFPTGYIRRETPEGDVLLPNTQTDLIFIARLRRDKMHINPGV